MTTSECDDLRLGAGFLGQVLADRYRIVAAMEQGGMGVIYRAWDLHASRYNVVKIPKENVSAERFAREMAMLGRIDHAHVVPILASGEHRGVPYAVMPYLAGGDLSKRRPQVRGKRVPAPASFLRSWLPPIAGALDHIHGQGFIHRDVKPSNILFDGRATPFLADFGVAKILREARRDEDESTITDKRAMLGTPDYICPHLICTGGSPDPRCDQYSLAVVVYELLAARKPTTGRNDNLKLYAAWSHDPPSLGGLRPELPASLCEAVHRALAKRPEERFDTCGDLAACILADVPNRAVPLKIRLVCPGCGILLVVEETQLHTPCRCPSCRHMMDVTGEPTLVLRSDVEPSAVAPTPANVTTLAPASLAGAFTQWGRDWGVGSRRRIVTIAATVACPLAIATMVLRRGDVAPLDPPVETVAGELGSNAEVKTSEVIAEAEAEPLTSGEWIAHSSEDALEALPGIDIPDLVLEADHLYFLGSDVPVIVPPPVDQLANDQGARGGGADHEPFAKDLIDECQRYEDARRSYDDNFNKVLLNVKALNPQQDALNNIENTLRALEQEIKDCNNEIIADWIAFKVDRQDLKHAREKARQNHVELTAWRNTQLQKVNVIQREIDSDTPAEEQACFDTFRCLPTILDLTGCFSRGARTAPSMRVVAASIDQASRSTPWKEHLVLEEPSVQNEQDYSWTCLPYPSILFMAKTHLDILEGDADSATLRLKQVLRATKWAEIELSRVHFKLPGNRRVELVWPVRCTGAYAAYLLEMGAGDRGVRKLPVGAQRQGRANEIRQMVRLVKDERINHPLADAMEALCELVERDMNGAAKAFKAFGQELGKKPPGRRRDQEPWPNPEVGDALEQALVGESAWFFAAAPAAWQDLAEAERLVAVLLPDHEATSWLGWRAKAAIAAEKGDWETAIHAIDRARDHGPLLFTAELDRQRQAYLEERTFRIELPRRGR